MPVIALTYPGFTEVQAVLNGLARAFDSTVYGDGEIMEKTAIDHGISPDLLTRVAEAGTVTFNDFTHEREKALSALEKTLSNLISQGNCIFSGILCHLIPPFATHVFYILALSSRTTRIRNLAIMKGCAEDQAGEIVDRTDEKAGHWGAQIKNRSLWDKAIYSLVLDMDTETDTAAMIRQIRQHLSAPPFTGAMPRDREVADLRITSDIHMALAHLGSGLKAVSENGEVTVTIHRKRMNLSQTQASIMSAVKSIPGVASLNMRIGPKYYESDMIKDFDFGRSTGV